MKSRLFFRENGHVIYTRGRGGLANAAFALSAIAVLLGLLAYGHHVDAQAEAQGTFEAGLVMGHAEMQETVAAAYHQGLRDALAAACPPAAAPAKPVAPSAHPMLLSWSAR